MCVLTWQVSSPQCLSAGKGICGRVSTYSASLVPSLAVALTREVHSWRGSQFRKGREAQSTWEHRVKGSRGAWAGTRILKDKEEPHVYREQGEATRVRWEPHTTQLQRGASTSSTRRNGDRVRQVKQRPDVRTEMITGRYLLGSPEDEASFRTVALGTPRVAGRLGGKQGAPSSTLLSRLLEYYQ